jgi:hypothetical protein
MKTNTVFWGILCIASLLVGFGVGKISERIMWQEKFSQVVQQELNWLLSQTSLPTEGTRQVAGTVLEKGDQFLIIEGGAQVSRTSLQGETGEQRIKVYITEASEIFQLIAAESPAEPSQKAALTLEDINPGDYVLMVSSEDARNKTEITAEKIQVSSVN